MEDVQISKDAVSYASNARPEFRLGDILCFRGRGLQSRLIRRMTKSRYSHAGLVYLHQGRVYCLEAVGTGVRLVLMSQLMKRYRGGIDYFDVDVSSESRERAVGFAFAQLGKLYDTAGVLRVLWVLLAGRVEKIRLDESWFCSELVAAAYSAAGLPIVELQASYTSPSDLAASKSLNFKYTLKP